MIDDDKRKRIVLIGGGFAALNFCRKMFNNEYYHVTVVDKNNYNYFTPLLYQVATGFLEPAAISYPFRKLFKGNGIAFRMGELIEVNTRLNEVYLRDGSEIYYDILIFATASKTNFFGNRTMRKNALSIKGIDDSLYMRNELIKTFEKAYITNQLNELRKLLTVVIAGGGATGVELEGVLAELKNGILKKEYPELGTDSMKIYLIEGAPCLLPATSNKTHKEAYEALQKLGISVKLNTTVNNYDEDIVRLSDGTSIPTKTLIWAAGVTVNKFEGIAADSVGKGNRLITNHFNQVKGYENVYAIGDNSIQYTDEAYPDGHPQLAQPAIQQGRVLAKNLLRIARGKAMKPFHYFDKGDMAIIGRKWAVADLFKHRLHIGGLLGLLAWLFIHLVSLVNYNNKVRTLFSWLVAYVTQDQVLRMIFLSDNSEKGHQQNESESQKVKPTVLKERFVDPSETDFKWNILNLQVWRKRIKMKKHIRRELKVYNAHPIISISCKNFVYIEDTLSMSLLPLY